MQNLKERLKTFDEDLDRVKKAAQKISNDLNGANEEPMNESNVPQQPHISRSNSFVRSGSRQSGGSSGEGMRRSGGEGMRRGRGGGGDVDHDTKTTRIVSDLKMTPREWYDPGSLLLSYAGSKLGKVAVGA